MVVVAGLLVLAGLGLFVAGVLTAVTAWYWACVVACALAAVLLVVARLRAPARDLPRTAEQPVVPPGPAVVPDPATPPPLLRAGDEVPAERPDDHRPDDHRPDDHRPDDHRPDDHRPDDHRPDDARPGDDRPEHRDTSAYRPYDALRPADPAPRTGGQHATGPSTGARHAVGGPAGGTAGDGDPAEEDVEVTDLLVVVDLADEVLVVDEHPRYHLADCAWLAGRSTFPMPVREARTDGFTPCGRCGPDGHLAAVERARRASRRR
ncbi:hypothetical protein SAMN05660657_03033 [Geodermatophilus amargosae]|uniref:Uncharacterized protein n=1 Tax=Geodermatophilus amargosae TaxID=1296565 RepID=A0A1I7ASK7_9ACTN|nr:hypothetical protein [Geodermatophilus amargosae]SFT77876.1 hypothetical protein SAMN05660657_03033 [Geodermatophilus amargosae]